VFYRFISCINNTEQLQISLTPQVYFSNERYFVDAFLQFAIFPYKFWGIGNDMPDSNLDAYNSQNTDIRITFLRQLPPAINFGFRYYYYHVKMLETQDGGQLDTGKILGSQGGTQTGLGLVLTVDTRNSIQQPYQGRYYEFSADFASRTMGSDFTYASFVLDFRNYRYLGSKENMSLAFQLYFQITNGEVPFQRMAQLGGGIRGRGYFRGRYMDLSMYTFQLEYRWKFNKRWSMAAFFSTGDVAPMITDFKFSESKASIGGGIRFKIRKDDDTVIRLDYGYGFVGPSTGIYFGVNEAF
jgi:hypothetical protein